MMIIEQSVAASSTQSMPKVVSRLGLILTIAIIVIVSSIFLLVSPILATAASSGPTLPNTSTTRFSPSTISQDGRDFTAQAAISSLTARPTNNIVNTNSFYDVVFLTATSGTIKTIQVTFPAGTTIPNGAFFNEAEKCVSGSDCTVLTGTASKSGQTITYTVTNAVNVPAGTKLRLELANINNPLNPSANYKVTVSTRDAGNTIIDGPSQSVVYTIKQIGKNAIANNAITTPKIADNSITSTKPAESFMKRVTLLDDVGGHDKGWNPNGGATVFQISEPDVILHESFVAISVTTALGENLGARCFATPGTQSGFQIQCENSPQEGSQLHYVITRLPAHVSD